MPRTVAVVIPTYNERANLRVIVEQVLDLIPDSSIIVVDDGSPDGTGDLADQLAIESRRVHVIHRARKDGIGPAYVAGFTHALEGDADLIVAMDADGSHAPIDLVQLIARSDDADMVLGSRYVSGGSTIGWPMHRRWLSRLGGFYARLVLGAPVRDLTSGFKVYTRAALKSLPLARIKSDGYGFQIETTWRIWKAGLRVVETPITFHDRVAGKSKLSRSIILEAILLVWKLRFSRG